MIFKSPQAPFIHPEFCNFLSSFIEVEYINGIPIIKGKTFYWSTTKFPNIKNQHLLLEENQSSRKDFFYKEPSSYEQRTKDYHQKFRNQVKKSYSNNLIVDFKKAPSPETIKRCYSIYRENMKAKYTFYFDYEFFRKLLDISFSELITISDKNTLLGFGILLGNLLFIESSTSDGKNLCANNLIYDKLLKRYENHVVYFGIASKNNRGLWHFKKRAGLSSLAAKATFFELQAYVPVFLRENPIVGLLFRFIKTNKILSYLLPY